MSHVLFMFELTESANEKCFLLFFLFLPMIGT
jgi:hypothetical protein